MIQNENKLLRADRQCRDVLYAITTRLAQAQKTAPHPPPPPPYKSLSRPPVMESSKLNSLSLSLSLARALSLSFFLLARSTLL
jgi:hypothetical protein